MWCRQGISSRQWIHLLRLRVSSIQRRQMIYNQGRRTTLTHQWPQWMRPGHSSFGLLIGKHRRLVIFILSSTRSTLSKSNSLQKTTYKYPSKYKTYQCNHTVTVPTPTSKPTLTKQLTFHKTKTTVKSTKAVLKTQLARQTRILGKQ